MVFSQVIPRLDAWYSKRPGWQIDNSGLDAITRCFWPVRESSNEATASILADKKGVAQLKQGNSGSGWLADRGDGLPATDFTGQYFIKSSPRWLVEGVANDAAKHVAFGVSAWFHLDNVNNRTIIAHATSTISNYAWRLAINTTDGGQVFFGVSPASDGTGAAAVAHPVVISTKTHIVASHDPDADLITIVKDGDWANRVTAAYSAGVWSSSAAMTIGANADSSLVFDGRIWDVAYFTAALTQAQVADLYNGGNGNTYQ